MADISYEPTALSIISAYSSVSDVDIIKKYKETKDPLYGMIMLSRHEGILVDCVVRWRAITKNVIPIDDASDWQDLMQTAYSAMLICFDRMKNPDIVRNTPWWLKGYVFNELNVKYKHRKKEQQSLDELPELHTEPRPVSEHIDIPYIYKSLTGQYAKLFKLMYIDQLSNEEIEKVMFAKYSGKRRHFMAWRAREAMHKQVRKLLNIPKEDVLPPKKKKGSKGVQSGC